MTVTRIRRAAGISVGLLLTGAVAVAAVGVGVLAAWGLLGDRPGGFPYVWFAIQVAAAVGALLGGVLLPLIAWTILPQVTFARILAETALGTAVGAGLAILPGSMVDPLDVLVGGILGCGASVVRLRLWPPPTAKLPVRTSHHH